jgi:hypothetical protein
MGDNKEKTGRLIRYLKETGLLYSNYSRRKMIRNGRLWIAKRNKNEKEQRKGTQRMNKKED